MASSLIYWTYPGHVYAVTGILKCKPWDLYMNKNAHIIVMI